MELLRSAVLRVPHGFPTRAGGVSVGPFASLNCSFSVGDDARQVEANLDRVAAAAQVPPRQLFTVQQVHGDAVLTVAAEDPPPTPFPSLGTADALISGVAGTALGIRTADCAPVLLEDPDGRQVAAVHAGWRGVVAALVPKVIAQLARAGARPSTLRAAVGPCIQACCFEVDDALADRFERQFGAVVVVRRAGAKSHVDLPAALSKQLEDAGITAERREALGGCTHCDPRFFSHRRDRGVTGRHLSFITHAFATRL